jgi:hypothetical protein
MVNLVGLAGHEQRPQRTAGPLRRQLAQLRFIMVVDKGLDSIDRQEHRALSHQRGQKTGQPARDPP